MDLSEVSARVRLNIKRSPLESQEDRSKQRRALEDPDEDEVIIAEVQVNLEVEHPRSEVSATQFDDWQRKEYEGILIELQSQNDFMSFHDAPSSEVANKEVIRTRWVKHFNTQKTRTTISLQEHQLQCRSIWFWLWQQNVSHSVNHKQLRVSMFPLRFVMRR